MECLCQNENGLFFKDTGNVQVQTLFCQSVEAVFNSFNKALLPEQRSKDDIPKCHCRITAWKEKCQELEAFWRDKLPATLADQLLHDALQKFDNQKDIGRLLLIIFCTMDSTRPNHFRAPLYLYPYKSGRMRLLERWIEQPERVLKSVRHLCLDMYNFYHRGGTDQMWPFEQDQYLEMSRVQLDGDEQRLVLSLIGRLDRLVYLCVHTVCSDLLLAQVGKVSQCLVRLDISFSKNVSDQGMVMLATGPAMICQTLRILELESTLVTRAGVAAVLASMPGLTCLKAAGLLEEHIYSLANWCRIRELDKECRREVNTTSAGISKVNVIRGVTSTHESAMSSITGDSSRPSEALAMASSTDSVSSEAQHLEMLHVSSPDRSISKSIEDDSSSAADISNDLSSLAETKLPNGCDQMDQSEALIGPSRVVRSSSSLSENPAHGLPQYNITHLSLNINHSSLGRRDTSFGGWLSGQTATLPNPNEVQTDGDRPRVTSLGVTTKIFPHLTDLKIHNLHHSEWEDASSNLEALPNLSSLMIGGAPMGYLVPGLRSIGRGLTSLRLVCYESTAGAALGARLRGRPTPHDTAASDHGGGLINFSTIVECCPRLTELSLSGNAVVYTGTADRMNIEGGPDQDHLFEQQWTQFPLLPHLTKVSINVHAYIPFLVWTGLLGGCPVLHTVDLTKCEAITDASLERLMRQRPECLRQLRRFCIRGAHRGDIKLTRAALGQLQERAGHSLEYVGDCFTWCVNNQRSGGGVRLMGGEGVRGVL